MTRKYGARVAQYSSDLRIGEYERNRTTNLLNQHYAEGRLSKDELDARTSLALKASATWHLDDLVSDLPKLREKPKTPPPLMSPALSEIEPISRKALTAWIIVLFVALCTVMPASFLGWGGLWHSYWCCVPITSWMLGGCCLVGCIID